MTADVLAVVLVVLPVFDWAVAVMLGYIAFRNPHILTLRERSVTAVMLAIVATAAAVLAFARFGVIAVTNGDAITLLAASLVVVSVPAMVWLFLLLSGQFRFPNAAAIDPHATAYMDDPVEHLEANTPHVAPVDTEESRNG